MGYTIDTIKGVSWVGGLRLITRVLSFGRIAIIARIFTPSQLGTVGIATLVLAFVEILTETGINVFLIQQKEGVEKYIHTAWIISIIRGVVIAASIALAAPFVAQFFHSPESLDVLFLISAVPLVRGFINPAIVRLQKELMFDREFWVRSTIFLIETVVTVVLSVWTHNPASLVWGFILGALAEVIISFVFIKPTPSFLFELALAKKVISRGKWVTAYGISNYAFENIDDTVVGRVLGVSPLGLYQTAYKISSLPITEITEVVGRVTFPVYIKIVDDLGRLKKAFVKTTIVIAFPAFFLGLIFFFFPTETIILILGAQWVDAAPVLRVLAILGIVRAICHSMLILFLSVQKQELVTLVTFVGAIVLAVTIVPLVSQFGIVGASFSALLGQLSVIPIIVYFTWKILNGRYTSVR